MTCFSCPGYPSPNALLLTLIPLSAQVASVELEGSHFGIDIVLEAAHNIAIVTHRQHSAGRSEWIGRTREQFVATWLQDGGQAEGQAAGQVGGRAEATLLPIGDWLDEGS